ncbi:MAG: universal stress protein [Nitrospirae bacterium]|nr:universal stress protein [Nitrospirota bacterium]
MKNSIKKILMAHDGSKDSNKALKIAVEIALRFDSALYVLSVVPELYLTELTDFDRQRITEALTEETNKTMEKVRTSLASHPIEHKTLVRQGDPAETILDTARKMKVSLIVTGSHGRHGATKFLLGSVSSKVLDHAHCPVLVVK